MGLDVSHGAFRGAYSAFNRLRQVVAAATGGSFPPHDDKMLDPLCWYVGEGYSLEMHPGLCEFLAHSDCDGEISPEMCRHVAVELEALLPQIRLLDKTPRGHIQAQGGYVAVVKKFIAGCRQAADRGESLVFC